MSLISVQKDAFWFCAVSTKGYKHEAKLQGVL